MKALVCLAHTLVPAQEAELKGKFKVEKIEYLKDVSGSLFQKLTNCQPETTWLKDTAKELFRLCSKYDYIILPIGSPAFMWVFATEAVGAISALFAHSVRKSFDVVKGDGTVEKKSVFEHVKFIEL